MFMGQPRVRRYEFSIGFLLLSFKLIRLIRSIQFPDMNIDIDQLITFERIVREGSFSAASLALDIPQPTVSARIKTLEQTLGGLLFHRQGRKVTLTDLGQTFLPYAQRTIAVLSEGVEMARQAERGQRGRVTYGGLASLSGALVGPAVAHFHAAHPRVELIVRGGDHEGTVEWLRDRIVELGLVVWPCPESVLTPMQPLLRLREPVVLVVSANHVLAGRGSINYADLLNAAHPFLSLRWWKTMHPTIEQIAAQSASSITVSMESARHMVRAGIGLGFFTRVHVLDDLNSGVLAELTVDDLPPITRDSALVWLPRESPLSAAAESFIECLRVQAVTLGLEIISTGAGD
jgi:DNA-binding transcriptional LysR family regulator